MKQTKELRERFYQELTAEKGGMIYMNKPPETIFKWVESELESLKSQLTACQSDAEKFRELKEALNKISSTESKTEKYIKGMSVISDEQRNVKYMGYTSESEMSELSSTELIERLTACQMELEAERKRREWISIKDRLPDQDQLVIWYAKITWREKNPISIFVDRLTGQSEHIEYGEYGYLLHDHDMYVYDGDQDLLDERVTHWQPLPENPSTPIPDAGKTINESEVDKSDKTE